MSDTRTPAEKEAAKAIVDAYKHRRQAEQDAKAPNPRQQPPARYAEHKR